MDEWGFFQTVQQFIDPVAIIFAVTICWLVKKWFFTADGEKIGGELAGTFWGRIFPSTPVLLATAFVLVSGWDTYTTNVLVSKGVISGAVAGYLNRTWKVTVLGE